MTEAATATPAKPKTEYEKVGMKDGREVEFPGKRQVQKSVTVDEAAGAVSVRFDFRNGDTATISSGELPGETQLLALGHGLSQKCGDEAAGAKKIEDIVAAVTDMMGKLKKGEWRVPSTAGDSFSGTHIVIQAICEATGKSVEQVKAFLQGKLDAAKAAVPPQSLSRQELYASFRRPDSKVAAIISRLEAEDAAKGGGKVSANDLLAELG